MNILIKSFFRPYLLDRCLQSIKKNVTGYKDIIILDDGTPQIYLNKIQEKYPEVIIKKSQYYKEKVRKIDMHLKGLDNYYDKRIPSSFWLEEIEKSSEILILTEDDVWFTDFFDCQFHMELMLKYEIHLLKLGYSKDSFSWTTNFKLEENIFYHNPKIIFHSRKFYGLIFNNSFKIRNLLSKCGFLEKDWKKQFWLMYNIPMGMYNKNYLKYIWRDKYPKVNESLQLLNCLEWHLNHISKNKFAFIKPEVMSTTYKVSASFNSHMDFDLIKMNNIINELWLNDSFDSLENYPNDFSDTYIETILSNHWDKTNTKMWLNWATKFKKSFESAL